MSNISKNSKIYIAGHRGMVGSACWDMLKKNGYKNLVGRSSKQLDLRNQLDLDDFISKQKPDLIINAAGKVGGILFNLNNNLNSILDNNLIGLNLIRSSISNDIKYLLNISSSCIYPNNIDRPIKEDDLLTGGIEQTNEGYALSKINVMKTCQYIDKDQNEFLYKTIIPCNLFGVNDNFDSQTSHLIPGVISRIHNAKTNGLSTVDMWGDGNARREFMFVEDLANFVLQAINKNFSKLPSFTNVGYGKDYSIKEYYIKISEVIGYKGDFKIDKSKPTGMKRKLIDSSVANQLGWKPIYTIEEGLNKTYQYYITKIND